VIKMFNVTAPPLRSAGCSGVLSLGGLLSRARPLG
jgi:hypothetical protein